MPSNADLYQRFNPTVSIVAFNASGGIHDLYLETSDDYSVGKLVRNGLDAVYGIDKRGRRIYNPVRVRKFLNSLEEHKENVLSSCGKGKGIIAHGGHGNIGLNNHCIAYRSDKGTGVRFLVPRGEPVHLRRYPSFVKSGETRDRRYGIDCVRYLYDGRDDRGTEIVRGREIHYDRSTADLEIDTARDGDCVYLPLVSADPSAWDRSELFRGAAGTLWPEFDVLKESVAADRPFARIPRTNPSRSQLQRIRVYRHGKMAADDPSPMEEIRDVEFSFFGIPAHPIPEAQSYAPGNLKREAALGAVGSSIIGYAYDLRHFFDLGAVGVTVDGRNSDFYLFERALKQDGYAGAGAVLRGGALAVDLKRLRDDVAAHAGSAAVVNRLDEILAELKGPGSRILGEALEARAYAPQAGPADVRSEGDYHVDAGAVLTVRPRRNVYPFSFIGAFECAAKRFVFLAAASGLSGIRPKPAGALSASKPGSTFEEAVEAVVGAVGDIRSSIGGCDPDAGFTDSWELRMLCLDQGEDVHQFLKGCGYLVGAQRDQMSGELFLVG